MRSAVRWGLDQAHASLNPVWSKPGLGAGT